MLAGFGVPSQEAFHVRPPAAKGDPVQGHRGSGVTLCTLIVNCSLAFVDSILWLLVDHVCVKTASVNVVTPDQTYR